MESSRRADLSLLGERALRNQGRAQQTEKAVDRVTPGRLPYGQPMSLADRSNVLRYGDFPDSKYPPSNNIHGQKDVERKVAPGTQVENPERHEASTVPTRGWEDLNSQRIGMDLKHRRDLRSEGRWFKDALFRRDEILAPRMEALGIEEEDYPVIDLGNAAAYHRNDDFVQQARNTLTRNYRQAVLGASDRFRNQYEAAAQREVHEKGIQDEKERKKDKQRKRRPGQAIKAETLKMEEAEEKARNAPDEEQRERYMREVEKAQKKIKQTQATMDRGNGPDEIHELTPLAPNLEGGTTLSRTQKSRLPPRPPEFPGVDFPVDPRPQSPSPTPIHHPDASSNTSSHSSVSSGWAAPAQATEYSFVPKSAAPNPPFIDSDSLSDDEGDRKAADPTTDHNAMFITYTISEDRTGNQEGITRKRLAALGARCVLRMSRPQAEELDTNEETSPNKRPKSSTCHTYTAQNRKTGACLVCQMREAAIDANAPLLDDDPTFPHIMEGSGAVQNEQPSAAPSAQPALIRPEQVKKLPHLNEETKARQEVGIQKLWDIINSRPPNSPEQQQAYSRLSQISATLMNGIRLFQSMKKQQVAAQAGQQNGTPISAMPPSMGNMGANTGYQLGNQHYHRHNYPPVNPADQNPPNNTLHVGNLPIDTSEDELKNMFSKQRGYKRLCFRTKQNGLICFVEFEDVSFATRALTELYGAPLHNSAKGGIRLSFSKNPLGVRTGQSGTVNPPTPLSPQGIMSRPNVKSQWH